MDWQHVLFDWNQARAFLATAEEGSLSAAGRALRLTQPAVGRQVRALEHALGLVLFERMGPSLRPTPSGVELMTHVRAMRDAASRLSLTASGQSQAIEGRVRITASDIYSAYVLPPMLRHLRSVAPGLEIDLVAANDVRDLLSREADIAIRHLRPTEPDLVARLIREARAYLYGGSSYLDARGRPATLADLPAHDFVGFGDTGQMVSYLRQIGVMVTDANFRIGSENGIVAWEMVRQGFGLAPMDEEVAAQARGVERVVPDMAPIAFPVWLIAHREVHSSRRIRLVFDALADGLRRGPAAPGP